MIVNLFRILEKYKFIITIKQVSLIWWILSNGRIYFIFTSIFIKYNKKWKLKDNEFTYLELKIIVYIKDKMTTHMLWVNMETWKIKFHEDFDDWCTQYLHSLNGQHCNNNTYALEHLTMTFFFCFFMVTHFDFCFEYSNLLLYIDRHWCNPRLFLLFSLLKCLSIILCFYTSLYNSTISLFL